MTVTLQGIVDYRATAVQYPRNDEPALSGNRFRVSNMIMDRARMCGGAGLGAPRRACRRTDSGSLRTLVLYGVYPIVES